MRAIVSTHGLRKEFRGFVALHGVDLKVAEGSVHALVGPNGAGKTTLFNLLNGFLRPPAGRVQIDGRDVTGLPPERIARLGVARSFQITNLFPEMSTRGHLELALQARTGLGWQFWCFDRRLRRFRRRALELLADVGRAEVAENPAGVLAYGRKRALELVIALAPDPRVLLLDEPTSGRQGARRAGPARPSGAAAPDHGVGGGAGDSPQRARRVPGRPRPAAATRF